MVRGAEYLNSGEKRTLDVLGAAAIGCAALPLVYAARIMLAQELRVPFADTRFRQQRHGGGQAIEITKLRTLPPAPDERSPTAVYGTFDHRTGLIGTSVRASGIDEVPQVVTVLRGDMSLVGSRPMTSAALEDTKPQTVSYFPIGKVCARRLSRA